VLQVPLNSNQSISQLLVDQNISSEKYWFSSVVQRSRIEMLHHNAKFVESDDKTERLRLSLSANRLRTSPRNWRATVLIGTRPQWGESFPCDERPGARFTTNPKFHLWAACDKWNLWQTHDKLM